jgi:hypothetical protein
MPSPSRGPASATPVASAGRCGLVVCRGCCCGDPARNPATDHEGQLRRLREAAGRHPAALRVQVSDCLGPCEHANVVVARPSPRGRRAGGRPVWFGLVLDDRALVLLENWVRSGGPGLAPVPDELTLHQIRPPR